MFDTTHPTRVAVAASLLLSAAAHAQSPASTRDPHGLQQLRQQIEELKRSHEQRIHALEAQLAQTQQQLAQQAPSTQPTPAAPANASPQPHTTAAEPVDSLATTAVSVGMASGGANRFNPAVSLILTGGYAGLSKSPDSWQMAGFLPSGDELGPGPRGFSLRESELTLSANIDHLFYGAITLAVSPENTIEAEEAFVQTTALPAGLKLKTGRFFAGLGYLNEQHAHTWDMVDAPLVYQAFLGRQFKQEGVQGRWVLPFKHYVELGLELGNGNAFPGSARDRNGAGATLLNARTGGDIGLSNSWRAGVSWLQTRADGREWTSTDPVDAATSYTNAFTGRSRIWALDGVWKWAPNGNGRVTNFKLQGEYFRRTEQGQVAFDTEDLNSLDGYRSAQSGWYLQGVYQFMPQWRVGVRHDQLDSGRNDFGANTLSLALPQYTPKRDTLLLEWAPSEYTRWRLQFSDDRARLRTADHQFLLQYQMSLGAHGAHSY
jgi:hypothetical protein